MDDYIGPQEPHRARGSAGPIVLLLPLAVALLAFSFLKEKSTTAIGPRAEPPQHRLNEQVEGWQGEFAMADGVRWRATLGPLHGDSVRQDFDSEVLKQRFGLRAGQVFRLVLSEVSNSSSAAARELPLPPAELVVEDSEGQALSLLVTGEPGLPADPLRVLFGAPSRSLAEGSSASWILWGRAPASNARIPGFVAGRDLVLEARSIPRDQVDVALVQRTQ